MKLGLILIIFLVVNSIYTLEDMLLTDTYQSFGERIEIKHHIAYRFVRQVKEVVQTATVTRNIDVFPLLQIYDDLKENSDKVQNYCSKQRSYISGPAAVNTTSSREPYDPYNPIFYLVRDVKEVSAQEAEMICAARQMKLPEVYFPSEQIALAAFLKSNKVRNCHAGLKYDFKSGFSRFISTGLPIWKGYYSVANYTRAPSRSVNLDEQMEHLNADYFYSDSGEFHYHEIGKEGMSYHGTGRIGNFFKNLVYNATSRQQFVFEFKARTVCVQPYNGSLYNWLYSDKVRDDHLVKLKTYTYLPGLSSEFEEQESTTLPPKNNLTVSIGIKTNTTVKINYDQMILGQDLTLQYLCDATAEHLDTNTHRIGVSINKVFAKLGLDELATHNNHKSSISTRATPKSVQAFFRSSLSLIRELHELVKQIPSQNKSITAEEIMFHLDPGDSDSNHSPTKHINEKKISANRIELLEPSVSKWSNTITGIVSMLEKHSPVYRMTVLSAISAIEQLVTLTSGSLVKALNTLLVLIKGNDSSTLEDLLLGNCRYRNNETSETNDCPNLIYTPLRTKIWIDSKQQLLVMFKVAEKLSNSFDIVEQVPIPALSSKGAEIPSIDSKYVLLKHPSGTYKKLSDKDVANCPEYCELPSPEFPIDIYDCGVPQLFDKHPDACTFTAISASQILLQTLSPGKIVYAVQNETQVRMYCENDIIPTEVKTVKHSGLLVYPAYCNLVLMDHAFNNVHIKSLSTSKGESKNNFIQVYTIETPRTSTDESDKAILTLTPKINRNKDAIVQVDAKLWGCVAFIITILSATLILIQVLRQRIANLVRKSPILVNPRAYENKMIELDSLRADYRRSKINFEDRIKVLEQVISENQRSTRNEVTERLQKLSSESQERLNKFRQYRENLKKSSIIDNPYFCAVNDTIGAKQVEKIEETNE